MIRTRFSTMIRFTRPTLALWLTLALTAWLLPALAAGPEVNTAVDENDGSCSDGDCSLRDAIATTLDGETITFAGDYTIYLTSPLTITKRLTIDGGNRAITVSGDTNNNGSPDVPFLYQTKSYRRTGAGPQCRAAWPWWLGSNPLFHRRRM